jgi:hypothetical protein
VHKYEEEQYERKTRSQRLEEDYKKRVSEEEKDAQRTAHTILAKQVLS